MPICEMNVAWIKLAQLQGQTYERLYSPEAIAQSEAVRRSRVQALVQSIEELEDYATRTAVGFSCFFFSSLSATTA